MRKYTETELKEVHQFLLGLLKSFKRICDENQIWYSLAYGTLLGAVRHKGFIPWDVDADVCIKLSDVDRFRKAFYEHSPEGIRLDDRSLDSHNTESHDCMTYEHEIRYPGVHLDIYPLVGTPNDKKIRERVWKRNYFIDRMFRSKYVNIKECLPENRKKVAIVKLLDRLIPNSVIRNNISKREYEFDVNTSVYWTNLASPYKPVEKKVWDELVLMRFEDDMYNVPAGWDHYLRTIYGEYMKPKKY